MNLARSKGYATRENAEKKLESVIGPLDKAEIHWVIAVTTHILPTDRFVPCVVGAKHVELAHRGITVIG
jgi:hypothetical protein